MVAIRTVDDIKLKALRDECALLLAECTEKQQAFFARLFPGGISTLTEEKLCHAIVLCQRTLTKAKPR